MHVEFHQLVEKEKLIFGKFIDIMNMVLAVFIDYFKFINSDEC